MSLRRFAVAGSAIIMALIAGRFGRRNAIAFGLMTIGISSIGIVSTDQILIMQIMSVTFGIGQSTLMAFESPFLFSKTTDDNRMHAFSGSFAAKNAAFMIGSLTTGALAEYMTLSFSSSIIGIRYALYLISVMSFIALIPLMLIPGESQKSHQKVNFKDIRKVYSNKLLYTLIYTAIIGFGAGMVVPFFGVYLKYQLSLNDSGVGIILAIAQLGTVIGGLMVPVLTERFGRTNTVTLVQMLSIPFLILIGVPLNIVLVSIAFFFRSSLMNMANPIIQNLYMEIVDDKYRPLVSSMRSTVNNLARALGILLGGFMMAHISYSSPYAVTILCYIVGTSIFRKIFKENKIQEPLHAKSTS